MTPYFSLKYRLIQRAMRDYGINPVWGCAILSILFVAISILLFRINHAPYFYVAIAASFTLKLSEFHRNDFLKSCFSVSDYLKVRFIENLLTISPFVVFLSFKLLFIPIIILLILSCVFVFVRFNKLTSITIPTPFGKHPYEFCVGFRYAFILLFFAYFLTIMAVVHDNVGLGFFSLILLFFTTCSFYTKLEPQYYIWSFAMTSGKFIFSKIKTAWLYAVLLAIPVFLTLSIYSPRNILPLLLIMALGCAYIATLIAAKYSSFPNEIGIPEVFVILLSIILPPLLLAILPMFYAKSVRKLNQIMK